MKTIKVIDVCDKDEFEKEVNELLEQGYKLKSCSSCVLQSELYDFCSCYQAIMLKEESCKNIVPNVTKSFLQ